MPGVDTIVGRTGVDTRSTVASVQTGPVKTNRRQRQDSNTVTPIKDFLVFKNLIYIRDHSNIITLCAIAASTGQLDWLVASLKKFHSKKCYKLHSEPGMRLFDDQLTGDEV